MAGARFNDPIEPMTLSNMRENGVRLLAIQCHQCRHEVIVNAVPSFLGFDLAPGRSAASVCETNDGTEDKEITIKFTSGERAERA
jgi:hypothetical protein